MGRGIENVAVRGLNFCDDVIALVQMDVFNGDGAIRADGEITDFHACLGFHLENRAGQSVAIDVYLVDGQRRPLVVLELHGGVAVRLQGDLLGRGVQNVALRDTLLRDGVDTGQQVLNGHSAILASGLGGDGGAVSIVQRKGHAGNGFAGVLVGFADGQIGPLVVLNGDGAGLAGEQFYPVLSFIQNVIGNGGRLLNQIDTRLQVGNKDFALGIGRTVEVVTAVLDFGDAERHTAQRGAIGAELDKVKTGLDGVGKHELTGFIGVQLNDPLGLVNDVARAGFFRHHIRAGVQLTEVDFAVLVGGELLGAEAAVHGLDLEYGVGNDFGRIGRIHLDQPQAGFPAVEEHQLQNAAACFQLDLLGHGLDDMFVIAGVPLLHAVGSRLQIGQQDFTQLVGFVCADGLVILEYLERDIGHDGHGLAVILENPQAGQFLVFEGGRDGFAGGNRNRHYSIDVRLPAVDTGDFAYLIGSGLEVGKNRCTARLGLLSVGGPVSMCLI